jgi:hypothetical protein
LWHHPTLSGGMLSPICFFTVSESFFYLNISFSGLQKNIFKILLLEIHVKMKFPFRPQATPGAMIFTNFLLYCAIKFWCKYQLLWYSGSWEDILKKIFSHISTGKIISLIVTQPDPQKVMVLTNLLCAMSGNCHVNQNFSGSVIL